MPWWKFWSEADTRMAIEKSGYRPTQDALPFPPGYEPKPAEIEVLSASQREAWYEHVRARPQRTERPVTPVSEA